MLFDDNVCVLKVRALFKMLTAKIPLTLLHGLKQMNSSVCKSVLVQYDLSKVNKFANYPFLQAFSIWSQEAEPSTTRKSTAISEWIIR